MKTDETLREHARMLGRAGGRARARKLSATRRKKIAALGGRAANARRSAAKRSEIGRVAAKARWLGRLAVLRIEENARRARVIKDLRALAKRTPA